MKLRVNRILLLFLIIIVWTSCVVCAQTVQQVGNGAEWYQPKEILMHTPGEELFLGIIHPAAALFERPFSISKAAEEHRNYIKLLEESGAKVHTVVGILLEGTMDESGNAIEGPELDKLRNFAKQFITIDVSAINSLDEQKKQKEYFEYVIKNLPPTELVKIILQRPTVYLSKTTLNTGYAASYTLSPVMNLYFLRDQMITTDKGVVISKMNSQQRAIETSIVKFVLEKLNVTPIYEVNGDGRLEGGDFIPAGDTAFIGQGLRTNAIGIKQLFDNKVFGYKRIVVVKEQWHNQDQMHLDTYFNVVGPKIAVLVEERNRPDSTIKENMKLKVDVYEMENGVYKQKVNDGDFLNYVKGELGYKLLSVSNQDQLRYGINFLTIAPNKVIAMDGVSDNYKKMLRDAGIDATYMDFTNMTGGYGGAHCVTQVLYRQPYEQANSGESR